MSDTEGYYQSSFNTHNLDSSLFVVASRVFRIRGDCEEEESEHHESKKIYIEPETLWQPPGKAVRSECCTHYKSISTLHATHYGA